MGKRKERRLAAMSAANRRVKLDLLAEPSEEAVRNTINEEVGVNQDQDHSASVPSSPSSSGGFHRFLFQGLYREDIPAQHIFGGNLEILQKICCMHRDFGFETNLGDFGRNGGLLGQNKENPLLLLGQYSDDELDDEANKLQKDADDVDYSTGSEGREHAVVCEDLENNTDEVLEASTGKQELDQAVSPNELKANDAEAIKSTCVDLERCETELTSQTRVSEPTENNANVVNEHWKLVLHEESNQYYYWNTVTGETSWEVPAALAVDTQNTDEQIVCSAVEERVANALEAHTSTAENVDLGIYVQVLGADEHETSNIISKGTEGYENMELKTAKVSDSSQSNGMYCTDNVTASYSNLSGYSNLSEHIGLHPALNNEEKDANLSRQCDRYVSEDAHASQLVQCGEALLQRLDMLYRSAQPLEGYEGIRKEIDIRLSDCRALSSYGSSLLPFWWHTEVQLKQIESAIDKIEASVVQTEKFSDMNARQMVPLEGSYSEVTEEHKIIVTSEFGNDITKNENGSTERASPQNDFQPQGSEHEPEIVPEANLLPDSSNSAPSLIDNAEDDMDVEMEVDEEIPSAPTSISVCPYPSEQFIQINMPSSHCPSAMSNESNVPPPPEEEWIPPPPPEEVEPLPPPPPEGESDHHPEEPPAPFPSSYTETTLYPFPDQYNVGYHIPTYGFYTSTGSEVSNGNYYGIVGGSQLIQSETPGYYEPLAPSILSEVAANVIPVGSATYYDVANVSISSGPVLSSAEPSAFYVESSAVNYQDMTPVSVLSSVVNLPVDTLDNYLQKGSKEFQLSTLQASSSLSTAQALGASSGNDSSLDAQPPAASKNQSKVVRSKKRAVAVAPTLRSNKKVSSLVDKWKAAKEELHGEEEVPENALEILEKKRQKEIEEWRARQVATGEAQDNANFVPLGGDWRERVKRRRTAEVRSEDAQTSTSVIDKEKKQPDLLQLSKDLPSGWQAFWDDSTKQVYYGNRTTSETTWNRPTR